MEVRVKLPPGAVRPGDDGRPASTRSQGALLNTGNPLDLAIEGDGYFQLLLPSDGSTKSVLGSGSAVARVLARWARAAAVNAPATDGGEVARVARMIDCRLSRWVSIDRRYVGGRLAALLVAYVHDERVDHEIAVGDGVVSGDDRGWAKKY